MMKNHFIFRYIAILSLALCMYVYGQNAVLTDECKNNFTPSCLALLEQAKNKNDVENIKFYHGKLLDIMDGACKRDYQTCLVLARIYEANENVATQSMQKDIAANKIPNINTLPTLNNQKDSTKKYFEDIESIVKLMRDNPDEGKALQYQEKAISLLEQACYDSDVRACLLLQYFYEHGVAVAQNRPKAQRLITLALELGTRECMLGNTESCKLLNAYPTYIEWIAKEIGRLERKCDEKDSISCYQSGLYYTQYFYINPEASKIAQDDKSDFIKAAQFLQKACKIDTNICDETIFHIKNAKKCLIENDMQACANTQNERPEFFALACEQGDMRSCYGLRYLPTFNDTKRYVKLLQRVCRGGIIESCAQLAKMYETSERVTKSKEKALQLTQRACAWSISQKADNNYCYFAGLGYERGEYVKQDIAKAIEAYQYSCNISNENAASCERLGVLYENAKQNLPEALKWYQKACNESKDSVVSCMQVAQHLINGEYLHISVGDAIDIYETLLQNKEAPHDDIYYKLANIYSAKEFSNNKTHITQENSYSDYAKALKYYKKACELGMQSSCGKKITIPNLSQECQIDNAKACYQLAMLTDLLREDIGYKDMLIMPNLDSITLQISGNTKPLAKDEKAASLILYKQACKGNVAEACKKLYKEENGVLEKDLALQEAMCLHLRPSKEAKSVCISFANSALQEKEYKKAIEALMPYQTKDDTQALDLLVQAYFYNKDYKQALDTYKRIYGYNMQNDYYYLAQMYIYGLGVRQNYSQALDIYKLSKTPRSYLGQAQMYAEGLGVSKSIFSAKDYYRLACPLDTDDSNKASSEACVQLGSIIYNEGDFQTAQQYYLKACTLGYNGDIISCAKQ